MSELNIGNPIPEFTSHDQNGNVVHSRNLIGTPFVLYFYPKDNTPGCTVEACSFRDQKAPLEQLNCKVIGVSPDGIESHKKFIQDHQINFTLLSDETKELCEKFGVLKSKEGAPGQMKIERTTFLVDAQGIIRWIERPVNVTGHTERVMTALETMKLKE